MKKLGKVALASSLSLLLLTACSSDQKGDSVSKKETSGLSVEILEGEFVTPADITYQSSTDFIAIKVKVENNTNNSLEITNQDFTVYDDNDEVIESKLIYDNNETIKVLQNVSLSKGKSAVGYLFYQIEKDVTDYEMKLSTSTNSKSDQKLEVLVDFDTENFVDNRSSSIELAQSYVNSVFLNDKLNGSSYDEGKSTNVDFKLSKDIEKDRDEFLSEFVSSLELSLSKAFIYYKPDEKEIMDLALTYISENSKKAEVDYNLRAYLPGIVMIDVKPKVLDSDSIDINLLKTEYLESKEGSSITDYISRQQEAEKYVFHKLNEYLSNSSVEKPSYMPSGGYTLTFVKDGTEWILDKNEYQIYSRDLSRVFAGF